MSTYRLRDFVDPIAITVQDPANSGFERFVGLEHYDSNELVIKRFSGVELLTTNAKAFQKNDLLIARRNVYLRRAGVVYFDGITSGDSIVLRVKEDCEKQTGISRELAQRVLPLVLNTDKFWIYANKHADGMNSKRISKDTLLDYEFDLPSIEEQKELADKLWAAYKVKESYRQLLSTTDEMLKAKFQEMFGDFLVNDRNWLTMPMSEVAPESPSKHGNKGNVWNLNLDMIESNTGIVIEKVYAPFEDLNSVSAFDKGNVLYSKLRPYLNKVVVPDEEGYATTELIPLRPNPEFLNLCFFSHLLRSDKFVAYANSIATGTKMPRVPMDGLRKFNCILPPMELQQQFAEIAMQAEATKASLRASIEAIDRVIRSLINQ